MRLDPKDEQFYHENGAVLFKGFFAADDLGLLARGIERNIEHPSQDSFSRYAGKDGRGDFTLDYGCHSWIPEYTEFARSSGLAELAARVLSSQRVCFFDDSYFIKEAGSEHPAPWHHDSTYYEIEGEILVAWIPLDPHGTYETLRLVAGSHRWGKRFEPASFEREQTDAEAKNTSDSYDPLPDLDGGEYEILAWEVEPGDLIFFNGLTLHGSLGNPTTSDQRRFNCRFVDESAVYIPRSDYPFDDGKANANVDPGQRLSDDSRCFPTLWEA